MNEAADPADPFGDIDELLVIFLLHQLFQPAVNEPDRRPGFDDLLVLNHQVEMNGFGQNRVLRTKGNESARHSALR